MRMIVVAAAICALISGCGDEEAASSDGVAARDSAGVRIVESAGPTWDEGEAWRLSAEPTLRIGVVEGEPAYQFHEIAAVERLGDGRIVVANAGTRELRFYDSGGGFLRAVGGEGEGPGEFLAVERMDLARDSLRVFDDRLRRVSVFSTDGTFGHSFTLADVGETGLPTVLGAFADGSHLVTDTHPFGIDGLETGIHPIRATYYRVSATGSVRDSLGVFLDGQHYVDVTEDGPSSSRLPFARRSVVAVADSDFYFSAAEAYRVRQFRTDGRLRRSLRLDRHPPPVTDASIDRYIRWRQSFLSNENARRRIETQFREMPRVPTEPTFSELGTDAEGNLWALDYRPYWDRSASRWLVFSPEGRFLGEVEMPGGFTPHEIGSDFVLGRTVGEADVEYVERYRLMKPGR